MAGGRVSDLRTVAEVAGQLRVSQMTVHRLVRSGELPAVRVGRSLRIPGSGVRRFLTEAQAAAV